jgi:predicted HTH domain antitoxin
MVRYRRTTGALVSSEEETFVKEPLTKSDTPIWSELRILVAAKLYGSEQLSSERAAKLAGIPHVEFLMNLGFYKVFLLQAELNELEMEHG